MFSESKQTEIKELVSQMFEIHIGKEYCYEVNFIEQDQNTLTKFSVLKDNKEILHIQNIMTPVGFKELENRKGWTAWAVEHAELLKKIMSERKEPQPKKVSFFKKLFGKCERQILGYSCNFEGKCEDCKELVS